MSNESNPKINAYNGAEIVDITVFDSWCFTILDLPGKRRQRFQTGRRYYN